MATSNRSSRARWARGAFLLALAGAAAFLANEQGVFDSLIRPGDARLARQKTALDDFDDEAPGPDELDDLELPSRNEVARSEDDDATLREGAPADSGRSRQGPVRHSQWSGKGVLRIERDDAERLASGALDSPIATVGFEEEAPPAPLVPDEGPGDGKSPASEIPAVAGRVADTARGTAVLRPGESKTVPLMDRKKIQELIDDGEYVDGQRELSRWYWQSPLDRDKVVGQLNKMAQALYFSPQPQYYDPYVVKPGDQLRVVGQRYKLSWEYIAKLNHVDARKIRMGQKLKIVPGPFAAVVFLDRYELVVHQQGSFVKSYRVGVGKDGTTPLGEFTVRNKMVDPTYYGPEGVIAHDDPNNPLGERWIDIGDGYGIHGTIDPESIGKNESRGCIRMLNSEVEEVYDFLVIGSEIKIQK